jgi:hypothetical protein
MIHLFSSTPHLLHALHTPLHLATSVSLRVDSSTWFHTSVDSLALTTLFRTLSSVSAISKVTQQ